MQLSTTILSIFRTEYNLFKSINTTNKRIFCHFFKYKRKKILSGMPSCARQGRTRHAVPSPEPLSCKDRTYTTKYMSSAIKRQFFAIILLALPVSLAYLF